MHLITGWRNNYDYCSLYSSLVLNIKDGERKSQEVVNPAVLAREELGQERVAITLNTPEYLFCQRHPPKLNHQYLVCMV